MPQNAKKIALGLEHFTDAVTEIVTSHDGFTIYAGGDDVLAILPLEDAMRCAVELRNAYTKYLTEHAPSVVNATISAAIHYVHVKTPLTRVLEVTHKLLDDVAKEACGRDAVAVQIKPPSGAEIVWAQPWDTAIDQDTLAVENLASEFRTTMHKDKGFSSRFFYKLKHTFETLGNVADVALAKKLMLMEYSNAYNYKLTQTDMPVIKIQIEKLLNQCVQKVNHQAVANEAIPECQPAISMNAALVIRFLANKGIDT